MSTFDECVEWFEIADESCGMLPVANRNVTFTAEEWNWKIGDPVRAALGSSYRVPGVVPTSHG